ncbi:MULTISPECIES: SDR family NAD(P)-dependent oxidoreductase [Protofrankia]|uniref:3-oxoacyl-ACP reductase n=1 Tax=Protofrankia coriariae TaxID=1562887 RepID=A0ABR5F0V4_9ACTN|nr:MULTISPECIES: SDR family NAD(P)-dependent oxidoreductase [Protofrankia]KLL10339.1 3-oxoacyl-ACP reductase [Protofrankia coriariae]ONH33569.1 3-oxoacyl-ACP reductase [Protofrankia sp. BMG5.30]
MGLLSDKVIIVTGASRGIGAAAARLFAEEGARVVLGARGSDELEKLAGQLTADGFDAVAVTADASTTAGVESLVQTALERYGRLNGAYLNAAVGDELGRRLADITEETWDSIQALTLRGIWLNLRAQIPELIKAGGGSIVIAGSVSGLVAGIGDAAYQAAKIGVTGLARAAAQEYAAQGIRVNVVAPGAILTDGVAATFEQYPQVRERFETHTPLGRAGTPREVAETVAWLLSDRSSYITGVTLPVDGGLLATRF